MINNRQGGRRRGRGGQRGQNLGGRPDGNRQDNRQRGNAAQLLEKYKSMARDAQLGGDRVQSEYYLQYAEHYYRILGENRARFEEQRRPRDDDDGDDDGDEEMLEAGDEQSEPQDRGYDERPARGERRDNRDQTQRRSRYGRDQRGDEDDRPQRNGAEQLGGDERIAFDVVPPAIGRDEGMDSDGDEAAARPRRRSRRPAAGSDEGEIAPAA